MLWIDVLNEDSAHVTNADLIPNDAEAYSAQYEWPQALPKFIAYVLFVCYSYEFVKCDVRQWKDQISVFKSALAKSPRKNVDIVIANAGISGADTVFNLGKTWHFFPPQALWQLTVYWRCRRRAYRAWLDYGRRQLQRCPVHVEISNALFQQAARKRGRRQMFYHYS